MNKLTCTLFALAIACGSAEKKKPTAAELFITALPKQRQQVEAYCACKDDACRDKAAAKLRETNQALMNDLAKTDLEKGEPPPSMMEDMKALSDRARECELPADKVRVDVPPNVQAMINKRMAEYAAKARKQAEAAQPSEPSAPEPRDEPEDPIADPAKERERIAMCKGAIAKSDNCKFIVPSLSKSMSRSDKEREAATHCFVDEEAACFCACSAPHATSMDDCAISMSTAVFSEDPKARDEAKAEPSIVNCSM